MQAGINLAYPAAEAAQGSREIDLQRYECRWQLVPGNADSIPRAIIIKAGEAMTASSAHAHTGAYNMKVCVLGRATTRLAAGCFWGVRSTPTRHLALNARRFYYFSWQQSAGDASEASLFICSPGQITLAVAIWLTLVPFFCVRPECRRNAVVPRALSRTRSVWNFKEM